MTTEQVGLLGEAVLQNPGFRSSYWALLCKRLLEWQIQDTGTENWEVLEPVWLERRRELFRIVQELVREISGNNSLSQTAVQSPCPTLAHGQQIEPDKQ